MRPFVWNDSFRRKISEDLSTAGPDEDAEQKERDTWPSGAERVVIGSALSPQLPTGNFHVNWSLIGGQTVSRRWGTTNYWYISSSQNSADHVCRPPLVGLMVFFLSFRLTAQPTGYSDKASLDQRQSPYLTKEGRCCAQQMLAVVAELCSHVAQGQSWNPSGLYPLEGGFSVLLNVTVCPPVWKERGLYIFFNSKNKNCR